MLAGGAAAARGRIAADGTALGGRGAAEGGAVGGAAAASGGDGGGEKEGQEHELNLPRSSKADLNAGGGNPQGAPAAPTYFGDGGSPPRLIETQVGLSCRSRAIGR